MTIQQVINLAENGVLKHMANNDTDVILGYLNLGLIELYKRFPLSVKEHIVELVDGITVYDLPEDCMWVIAVYGEVEVGGTSNTTVDVLPLNVEDDPLSVNTVSWDKVQVPSTTTGAKISIIYEAAPEYVTDADLVSVLGIPVQMVDAILMYIGYKAHEALGGDTETEDDAFYQKFEASCNRIEQRGMFTVDDMDMLARDMKGFV